MIPQHQIITVIISIAFMAVVLNLVRRRVMREVYSILWFLVGILFIVIASWERLLEWITVFMGAKYPASVLFFLGLIFVLVLLTHFSMELSALRKQNITLNQSLSILQQELDRIRREQSK